MLLFRKITCVCCNNEYYFCNKLTYEFWRLKTTLTLHQIFNTTLTDLKYLHIYILNTYGRKDSTYNFYLFILSDFGMPRGRAAFLRQLNYR